MSSTFLENINISSAQVLDSPQSVVKEFPVSEQAKQTIINSRKEVEGILLGRDKRLLLVVGPCAIYDTNAALEYAEKLTRLSLEVKDSFSILMRVYFEKPRTTTGWKGLINDPNLDDTCDISKGLRVARKMMLEINSLGLGCATEALDPIVPQYLGDLVSWTAIGARTAESQTHREMASGLSTAVGFKNGTDGNISVALNGIKSAGSGHKFLGINTAGQCSVFETTGNRLGHLVLRGGLKPNYYKADILNCEKQLLANGLLPRIIVDCSHGNSAKDPAQQPVVFEHCIEYRLEGLNSLSGLMLESNLFAGRQDLVPGESASLDYGVSITDACIDWETTEKLIGNASDKLGKL